MQNTEAARRCWEVAYSGKITCKCDLPGPNTVNQRLIYHQFNRTGKSHATWETLQVFWGRARFHGSTVLFCMSLLLNTVHPAFEISCAWLSAQSEWNPKNHEGKSDVSGYCCRTGGVANKECTILQKIHWKSCINYHYLGLCVNQPMKARGGEGVRIRFFLDSRKVILHKPL